MRVWFYRSLSCAGLLCLLGAAGEGAAQQDSVTIVPSTRYEAGPLRETLLGRDYRDAWSTPIRVPVLDIGGFDGGLTAERRGGGQQTRSLRLRSASGREYNFRSVDKWVTPDPRADLEGSFVESLVQDQVSSLHPSAVVAATGILDAVGVLNPAPRLVVMPDDARLGEFRDDFAGMLGTLEVHAEEKEDGSPDFAGAVEVESSEDVIELVQASAANRIDAPAYLRDRLVSLLLGDWDRHEGQFRWATFDEGPLRRWVPIPEDRDYAFSDYDGRAIGLVRSALPKLVTFGERYPSSLIGLTSNSAEIDRRVLAPLSRDAWRDAAAALRRDLTDAEIEAAVRRMPDAHFSLHGMELIRLLTARRDALPEVADRYYLELARQPRIHGTASVDRVEVTRMAGGSVRVLLTGVAADSIPPVTLLDRTFLPSETKEIIVDLEDGDDAAVVVGESASSIPVRVVGGAGADSLVDRSRTRAWTTFHDADGDGHIDGAGSTFVDRSVFVEPTWVPGEILPPRDAGRSFSWFSPWIGYEGTEGVVVGGGPSATWYGFRRYPHAARAAVRGMIGLESGNLGVDATLESIHVGSTASTWMHGRLSGLEAFRVHGRGNDSPSEPAGPSVLRYRQSLLEVMMRFAPGDGIWFGAGPVLEHLAPGAASSAYPHLSAGDTRSYGKVGMAGSFGVATRDPGGPLDPGFRLDADGRFFPAVWDVAAPFARIGAVASGVAALPGRTALAGRLGAAQVIGEAPLLENVTLGGSRTLRGHSFQRFNGDASLFGSIEARRHLTRVRLLLNADVGVLAFGDAGRVWVDGASEGDWHTAKGVGLWLGSLGRTASVSYALGEERVLYLGLGLPF